MAPLLMTAGMGGVGLRTSTCTVALAAVHSNSPLTLLHTAFLNSWAICSGVPVLFAAWNWPV